MHDCHSSLANVAKIQIEHRHYKDCPLELESVITDDSYSLFACVNHARLRVVSDGYVLFDGNTRPGMIRIAGPGEEVRVSVMSPTQVVAVTIPGVEMRAVLNRLEAQGRSQRSRIEPLTRPDERIKQAVRASFLAKDLCDNQRQLYIDGLAYSMLACLLNGPTRSTYVRVRSQGLALSHLEFSRCCEYADAMMEAKLDLRAWAEVLGMSTTEFTRRFQQFTHQTPYAWFLDRRIDQAKTLLCDKRKPIVDVALALGFCSQSHFTEAFRRRLGCSPARWRATQSFNRL